MASAVASRLKPHHLRLFFSNKYAYAQIFRIEDNHVIAAASTIEKGVREGLHKAGDKAAASRWVGMAVNGCCTLPSCKKWSWEKSSVYGADGQPGYGMSNAVKQSYILKGGEACPEVRLLDCRVGEVVAQRAQAAGVDSVHWPRKHGQRYHGKIAAMLEALKAQGVKLI